MARGRDVDEHRSLATLLSQVLVAFTIELDNEWEVRLLAQGRRRVVLVSFAMWANFLRFVRPGGTRVGELSARTGSPGASMRSRFDAFGRWRYIDVEPDPMDERARPPLPDWNVRLTVAGQAAVELWPPLPALIERRWRERFGEERMTTLFETLASIAGRFDTPLPCYVPLATNLYAGVSTEPVHARNVPTDLVQAMSMVLVAMTRDVERASQLPLVLVANVLRVLTVEGVAVRDLPLLCGISKEAASMSLKPLERRGWMHVVRDAADPRTKLAVVTPLGRRAQERYLAELGATERRWATRFGATTIETLRASLEGLLDAVGDNGSRMGAGLVVQPENWRARAPYLARTKAMMRDPRAALPHHPMLLHRGGWPDGS